MHNNKFCRIYNDAALPDENNKCSLCGAILADIYFEDKNIYLLQTILQAKSTGTNEAVDHTVYAVEPKHSADYKTYEKIHGVRIIT